MKYTLQWGPMGCVISPKKVIPLSDFKTSYALKEDSATDTSGSETTNKRGKELQPVSFSIVYAKATGNDPLARLNQWAGLIGKSYPLYLGGKRFGPRKMYLKQVDLSECLLGNDGSMIQATIAISLVEDTAGGTTKSSTSGNSNNGGSSSSSGSSSNGSTTNSPYSAEAAYIKAMQITAEQSERERLKSQIQSRR